MKTAETPDVDHVEETVREMREQLREAGETPERAKARTAAYAEARKQYPNQWAAIREVWDGARLVAPLVVVAAPSISELRSLVDRLPTELSEGITLELLRTGGAMAGLCMPPSVIRAFRETNRGIINRNQAREN